MLSCKILLNDVNKIADFVKVTDKVSEDIDLLKEHYIVDGHSLSGILSMDLSKPIILQIHTDNENELNKFNKWRI